MSTTRWQRSAMASLVLAPLVALGCGGGEAATTTASAPATPTAAAPTATAPTGPTTAVPAASTAAAPAAPAAPTATTAATTATAAPATPGGGELPEADEHRQHHGGGVEMLVAMSIRDLDLSDTQKAAVEKIRTDLLAKMEPARTAGRDLANTLADGVAAGAIDKAKVDKAIDKLATQAQALRSATLDAMNKLHAALTPAQRAALVDKLQEHWEKWKAAHGQDESEDKQHHSGYLVALVKELGLTQDEAQKIKAAFHEQMKAKPQDHQHKEVQDHLQSFATAFKADKFNAKSVAGGNAADAHIARWGATRRAHFLEAAAPVLTPDQRAKLAQIIRDAASRPAG